MSGRNRAAILARVAAVTDIVKSEEFARLFALAIDAAGKKNGTSAEVTEIALKALVTLGADLTGVSVGLTWDPSRRRLDVRHVRPAPRAPRVKRDTPPELRAIE